MQYLNDSTAFDSTNSDVTLLEYTDNINDAEQPHIDLANRTKFLNEQNIQNRLNINDATTQLETNTTDIDNLHSDTTSEISRINILYTGYNYEYISGFRTHCHSGDISDNCPVRVLPGRCMIYGNPDGTNSGQYQMLELTTSTYQYSTGKDQPPQGLLSYRDDFVWNIGPYYIYILKATDDSISTIASQQYPNPNLSHLETKWKNGYYRRIGSFIRTEGNIIYNHKGALYFDSIGKSNDRRIIFDEQNYCIGHLVYEGSLTNADTMWRLLEIKNALTNVIYIPRYSARSATMRYHSSPSIIGIGTYALLQFNWWTYVQRSAPTGGFMTLEEYIHQVFVNAVTSYTDFKTSGSKFGGRLYIKRHDNDLDVGNDGYAKLIGRSHEAHGFEVSLDPLSNEYYHFYIRQEEDSGSEAYYFSVLCEGYTEKL